MGPGRWDDADEVRLGNVFRVHPVDFEQNVHRSRKIGEYSTYVGHSDCSRRSRTFVRVDGKIGPNTMHGFAQLRNYYRIRYFILHYYYY